MPEWAVKIHGDPVTQGSMTCKGRHLPGTHQNLQPDNETELKHWRALVEKAGRALPVTGLVGPLRVQAVHTIERPRTIPLRVRAWPMVIGSGDVDKFGRALLDGLAECGVFGNDAQVCHLNVAKRYPDSPSVPWINRADHLDRPGVVIRIYPIGG